MNTPGLNKILKRHLDSCSFWIFSGDRHCSCGRDNALKELDGLRIILKQSRPFVEEMIGIASSARPILQNIDIYLGGEDG